jgi:hypothetical protein
MSTTVDRVPSLARFSGINIGALHSGYKRYKTVLVLFLTRWEWHRQENIPRMQTRDGNSPKQASTT